MLSFSRADLWRITPRTCLWPLVACLCFAFALSVGLTYRSDHHCYAGTCGETLFPLQARLHVVVWYLWISISVLILSLRAFKPSLAALLNHPWPVRIPAIDKQLRVGGLLLALWICSLYGILVGIWWTRLRDYFRDRASGLPGNAIVAAVAQTGHFTDVTLGLVLLPVSRHSALAAFFKVSHSTTFTFHMVLGYILFGLVLIHGALYARWAAIYNSKRDAFRVALPVLNPTYLYHEVWPGNASSDGIWHASLIFTGAASGLLMLVMFFTSLPVVRRTNFNVFYFTHLLGIVALVMICLHASTMFYCALPGLLMWILDWAMRLYELRQKLDCDLRPLGNDWFSLTLALPRSRLSGCACHSPLAHFYIHHTKSSVREVHPFTTITDLASAQAHLKNGQESIQIQFVLRPSAPTPRYATQPLGRSKQWTNRLVSLLDEENRGQSSAGDVGGMEAAAARVQDPSTLKVREPTSNSPGLMSVQLSLRLEGPYFTPASPSTYKTVVCLVGGTGLSGAIAIAASFGADQRAAMGSSSVAPKSVSRWQRCIVVWSVRGKEQAHMPFFEALDCKGLTFQTHLTDGSRARLDVQKTLLENIGESGRDCWCYISGSNNFIDSAELACRRVPYLTTFAARQAS